MLFPVVFGERRPASVNSFALLIRAGLLFLLGVRADVFQELVEIGPRNVGSIYGLMLTAWGFAGVCGPTLIAHVRQSTGHYIQALEMIAAIMLVSGVLPFVIRPPKGRNADSTNAPITQPKPVLNPMR